VSQVPPDATAHVGDQLSALLDGELDADQAAAVQAHLAGCDECRRELEVTDATRSMLRGLPFVDPPLGFVDGVIGTRRRRRHQAVAIAVLATIATMATLVVGGAYDDVPEVDTELATMADAHDGEPMGQPTPPDEVTSPMTVVEQLAGFERSEVHVDDELVQITYVDDDGDQLTVFEGYGQMSWKDELEDADEVAVEVDGDQQRGWMVHVDDARLLVVQAGDVVYALVGDTRDELVQAAEDLEDPGDDDGLMDRTRTVIVRVGETFSP
jgi:hypothetical protein